MRQPLASLQRRNPRCHSPNANGDRIHPQGDQRCFTCACGDSSNLVLAAHRNERVASLLGYSGGCAVTAKWLSKPRRHFAVLAKPYGRIAIGLGLVSVMAIGTTGSLASLGDTIFPSDSLRHALMQDFSGGHILLHLRLLHPVAAVMGSIYVFWLLWSHWRQQDHTPWMFVLAGTLTTQIALGAMNVILLAPIWLQMTHLLVAETFWILLVLASTDLLFGPSRHSTFPKAV